MTLDPNTIAAIGGVITAVGALVTSVHAHGKATGAKSAADYSSGSSRALERVLLDAIPQLVSALGVRLPITVNAPAAPVATTVPTPVLSAGDSAYVNWLREQHKAITGSYPSTGPGSAVTEYSKALEQFQQSRQ